MKRLSVVLFILCVVLLPTYCFALDVLVNQVGFESNSPKVFRVQRATDYAGSGTFSVRRVSDNATVHSGTLTRKGGLWNKFYWEGDFSSLSFANAAISERLTEEPLRFYNSGKQTIEDIFQLASQITIGKHPLFRKGTTMDFFG